MAEILELEIVTPERQLVRDQVSGVQLPGKDGEMGILPGHAPLLSQLGAGALRYTAAGRQHWMAVDGGFVEILEDHVRVLADSAEKAEGRSAEGAGAGGARDGRRSGDGGGQSRASAGGRGGTEGIAVGRCRHRLFPPKAATTGR
jgi:F-type H+-transporting ATPase subunit epsilon